MNVTNASLAYYSQKKRPKWASALKLPVAVSIDSVINSQAGIKSSRGEIEWGNLCSLLRGANRLHKRGTSIYGEKNLREYLEKIGPLPGTARARMTDRDHRVLRLLRKLKSR